MSSAVVAACSDWTPGPYRFVGESSIYSDLYANNPGVLSTSPAYGPGRPRARSASVAAWPNYATCPCRITLWRDAEAPSRGKILRWHL